MNWSSGFMAKKKREIISFIYLSVLFILAFQVFPSMQERNAQEKNSLQPTLPQMEEQLKTVVGTARLSLLNKTAQAYISSNRERSLTLLREALLLARKLDNPMELYSALSLLGAWYYVANQYDEAVTYYLEILLLEPRLENRQQIANAMVNIAMVYWKLKKYRLSETYCRRALAIRREGVCSPMELGATLNQLGLALNGRKKFTEALPHFLQALSLYKKVGSQRRLASVLTNINNVYSGLGEREKAVDYLSEALEVYKQIDNRWGEANALLGLGALNLQLGHKQSALQFLEKSMHQAREIDAQEILEQVYFNLSAYYEKEGDFLNASLYFDQFHEIMELQEKERKRSERAVMNAIYERQKKEDQLTLLRRSEVRDWELARYMVLSAVAALLFIGSLLVRFRSSRRSGHLLSNSEKRYRNLFTAGGSAVFLVHEGEILECNDMAPLMFGTVRDRFIGGNLKDFSPLLQPDGRNSQKVGRHYADTAIAGEPQRFYKKYLRADGTPFDAMVTLAAVPLERGPVLQAVIDDISQRRKLEEERIRSVKLETVDLLTGGIARDSNLYLADMKLNLEKAKGLVCGSLFQSLSKVEEALLAAEKLTEMFITIAEGGFLPMKPTDIGAVIRGASCVSNPTFPIQCDIPADLGFVCCDESQVRRLIDIVVKNAFDAVAGSRTDRQGKVTLSVCSMQLGAEIPQLPAGGYIRITVGDNGEGIAEDILPKVFDPYFTTRNEVTRKGLGMSLAVAQAVTARHMGFIKLVSQLGVGTLCTIYLPTLCGEKGK